MTAKKLSQKPQVSKELDLSTLSCLSYNLLSCLALILSCVRRISLSGYTAHFFVGPELGVYRMST